MSNLGQTRSKPDSKDADDSLQPPEKKLKLETRSEKDHTAVNIQETVPVKAPNRVSRKQRKRHLPEPYSGEDVLWRDVMFVLGKDTVDQALKEGTEWDSPFEFQEIVELEVSALSSGGDALAMAPKPKRPWVVVVPFALPGEKIRARVYRSSRLHSVADLVDVIAPNNELRDSSRIKCKYFGTCAGCQYQMLSYDKQLDLKRNVVVKAYQNFAGLAETSIPSIQSTIASPLQYEYRTKITPHFDAPPKKFQKKKGESLAPDAEKPEWLKIGFNHIGKRQVMDIEECPIATPVVNEAFIHMRDNVVKNIYSYKKGVSLLLRDSLEVPPPEADDSSTVSRFTPDTLSSAFEKHICITDHKATVRERVGNNVFEYPGGSFFQNNNSVLVPLTDYVRDAIFPTASSSSVTERPTHLVDAYCGSGLFAITLSRHFDIIAGIELSSDSIKFATHNARLNNIPEGKCTFRAGDAANIFAAVSDFPPDRTVLVIDPPRKGCDDKFIEQLLAFRCRTVVYVSCNVHTQARDVGTILKKTEHEEPRRRYALESLRGFDLFPQTAHVESVAVLRLV